MQMAPQMGYDRAITVFSPDGRIFQVEYAREAVKRGTTAAGIKYNKGVVLLVDKRITSKLIEAESIEKIFQIDEHIGVATSGLVADARALVDKARIESQINVVSYDEPIGVEVLSKRLCDHKQTYTQFGGVRPYGTALLIAGVDDERPRLFETDPSGALLEYKATAIGAGRNSFMEIFEAKYSDDMEQGSAIDLGMEAVYKSSEGKLDASTVEIGIVDVESKKFRKLSSDEVKGYVDIAIERNKKDEEIESENDSESENEESSEESSE
ncbi:archaeal proteasome endopeptidase complex subunit alpha [Methanosalsum natronophilum]|uniref:Proteasome subunit alpha n=1 Tax=Methanosalsum natronophilum TaxID=768733 RepID=A0A424Z4J6_9EURY|nr:archaeal proteasome endopeptidase complex subunit alpha [Methanosalsum natronophilum]MCS3924055.1 proteasome alpha subunit [Methanosalsum natronophilum]RQD90870.1 MAG: archaeal proteasome endopeptidase complex subunit alpha [Methanosalsum natronophilum]